MKSDGAVILTVDYASYFSMSGWAVDKETGKFPENFQIVGPGGETVQFSSDDANLRSDVNVALGLNDEAEPVGFSVNLFDVFNKRVVDYGVSIDGVVQWTFSNSTECLADAGGFDGGMPQNYGSKQVVVIYDGAGELEERLRQILQWQSKFFEKSVNSGVSYFLLSVDKFEKEEQSLLELNSESILIIERHIFSRVVNISPSFFCGGQFIVLGGSIKSSVSNGGLLSVICAMFSISEDARTTSLTLMRIFSAISGYSELFFSGKSNHFVYQSGFLDSEVNALVRNTVQQKVSESIVILTRSKLGRISELTERNCTVLVNISALKHVMDVMSLSTREFVIECYRRGLKVRILEL
jgi:hypothetical protein